MKFTEEMCIRDRPDIICVDTPVGLTSSIHMDQYSVELTGQEWVSRMEDSARSAVSVDDKVYGITFPGAKMYFYLYNKDIFSRLGLEAPVTYEEFRTVCQTIQDSETTPIYEATTCLLYTSGQTLESMLWPRRLISMQIPV